MVTGPGQVVNGLAWPWGIQLLTLYLYDYDTRSCIPRLFCPRNLW